MSTCGEDAILSDVSRCSLEIFEDETHVSGLLKTLISSDGLQTAWQRTAKHISAMETRLKQTTWKIQRFPEFYVSREEYCKLVENEHAAVLVDHNDRLVELENDSASLTFGAEKSGLKIEGCLSRILSLEENHQTLQTEFINRRDNINDVHVRLDDRFSKTLSSISDLDERSSKQHSDLHMKLNEGLSLLSTKVTSMGSQMKSLLEEEMQKNKVEIVEILNKEHVDPVRADLMRAEESIAEITRDMERQREDLCRQFRSLERKVSDIAALSKQTRHEVMANLEMCPRRTEFNEFSSEIKNDVDGISSRVDSLWLQTNSKIGDVTGNFANLQQVVDGHEHCLHNHAEELQNCSTKSDFQVCQTHISKAALKDDVDHDLKELQKVVSWQTNKIEDFGLVSLGARGKGNQRKKASTSKTSRSSSNFLGTANEDISSEGGQSGFKSVMEDFGNSGKVRERNIDALDEQTGQTSETGLDEQHREDSSLCEDDDGDAPSSLLRTQVEGLAMGVVGLAHLMFRETRLGQSRNYRLEQEQDLLTQLQNLRHWITHNTWPAGWDPNGMTTTALKCAHPRADTLRGPLPQLNLKNLSSSLKNPSTDVTMLFSAPTEFGQNSVPNVSSRDGLSQTMPAYFNSQNFTQTNMNSTVLLSPPQSREFNLVNESKRGRACTRSLNTYSCSNGNMLPPLQGFVTTT